MDGTRKSTKNFDKNLPKFSTGKIAFFLIDKEYLLHGSIFLVFVFILVIHKKMSHVHKKSAPKCIQFSIINILC